MDEALNERTVRRWSRVEWLIALFIFGAIRWAVLSYAPERLDQDPDAYRTLGQVWSQTGTFGVIPTRETPEAETESSEELDSGASAGNPEEDASSSETTGGSPGQAFSGATNSDSAEAKEPENLTWDLQERAAPVRATAYRPPLYPAILAGLDRFGWLDRRGIATLNWLWGVGSILLLAWLANRIHGRATAWGASFLLAIDPLSLAQSTLAMTETLATFLVLAAAVIAARAHERSSWLWSISAGLAFGIGALCRPPLLAWAVLLLFWELGSWLIQWRRWRLVPASPDELPRIDTASSLNEVPLSSAKKPSLAGLLVRTLGLSLGLTLALAPWGFRNLWMLGEFRVTTTHGGYTLFLANNRSFYEAIRKLPDPRDWQAKTPEFRAELRAASPNPVLNPPDELVQDRLWSEAAWRVIKSDISGFGLSTWTRVTWFWAVSPNMPESPGGRWVILGVAFFYGAMFSMVCFSLWTVKRWGKAWLFMGILVLVLTSIHSLYWSNPRMRTPISPWLCWTAAACLSLRDSSAGSWRRRR